jgi:hypothetical protein
MTLRRRPIYFASDYVADKVYEKFTASTKNTLVHIVNGRKYSWQSGIRGIQGQL